jgi:hypothetical protein
MNVNIENTTSKHGIYYGIYYFIYYFVYGNIGHIFLHSHVVNQDLWLMPLVIFIFKIIHVLSHVIYYLVEKNHDFYH